MTLEEYAVRRIECLEAEVSFLQASLRARKEELKVTTDAYKEVKDFLKKHIQKCSSADGYKMDKYFWESDPDYGFVANLFEEGKDA